MALVANDPKAAKRLGIPQSVGEDFMQADKGRKFKGGGMATDKLKKLFKGKDTYAEEIKEAKAIKSGKITPSEYAKGEKMEGEGMKKGGSCKGYAAGGRITSKGEHAVQKQSKRGAQMFKEGGVAKTVTKEMEYDYKTGKKSFAGSTAKKDAHAEKEGKIVAKHLAYDKDMDKMSCGGKVKKYARGGGIEVRGKTKGRII